MKRPENIIELNAMSFKLDRAGTQVFYPQFEKKDTYYPNQSKIKRFCSNNGTYSWVTEDSTQYVCTYFRGLSAILAADGYCEEGLFVPFSNGEYPVHRKAELDNLRQKVEAFNWEDTLEDVKEICTKKGVGDIPSDILSKLRIIPRNGIPYTHWSLSGKTQIEYPLITSPFLLSGESEKLGCFNQNNGTFVIHANNGMTYVTTWFEGLTDALSQAGYRQNYNLWVPFSNGEQRVG